MYFSWPKFGTSDWVLSCDGSLNSTRAGYGGQLKDGDGLVVVDYTGLANNHNVLWSELYALLRGLMVLRSRNIDDLIIHMDLEMAIEIINEDCL